MWTVVLIAALIGFACGRFWGSNETRALERRRVWRIFDVAFGAVSSGALTAVHGAVRGDYDTDRMRALLVEYAQRKEERRRLKSTGLA